MDMDIKYVNDNKVCVIQEKNMVPYITFKGLNQYEDRLVHGFSTRLGGISKEHLSSMNLSFSRGDDSACVMENHRRFAKALGYDEKKLVFSSQVHKTNFHKVTKEDCGKGIIRENDILETDGLVTNVADIPLITFYADCVPLLFFDPVKNVIAMAHSGWRGTIEEIGAKMVFYMEGEYGCKACDIVCAIAPSICQECYEVSEDVALQFVDKYEEWYIKHHKEMNELLYKKDNGKYQLNLQRACEITLLNAGILKEHLNVTDLCTCCNPDLFFSHRASHGLRGNLAAVMMLKSTSN